jgi:hypothetical protein
MQDENLNTQYEEWLEENLYSVARLAYETDESFRQLCWEQFDRRLDELSIKEYDYREKTLNGTDI